MTKILKSSVAAGALIVGVAIAPMSFAQDTTTPATPETQTMEPAPVTPDAGEQAQTPDAPAMPDASQQAQTPDAAATDTTTATADAGAGYLTEQAEDQISANSYIGQTVYNANDENVGEINDLIIEKDGGIEAAVIGVGGFLGIGEKNVAVPFANIEANMQEDGLTLKLMTTETADSLKAAPEFKNRSQVMAERNAQQTDTTTTSGVTPATPVEPEPAPQQ
ncbi:PRC-barrel domain-containing protein [Ensifer sp. LCM 4579]|uniref:PRC-barrel domain-containing protein n=1 Tax=Ensifer sp. LCM 4579 TaxID=1848292 RepID=UPI0008D9C7D7|nr:PRC-barrel domain-containing protein [Ensifer sp. LCM 4579]OHV85522.1 photosystem reaction center subunit H [Ensifer sp. LCM 4579]